MIRLHDAAKLLAQLAEGDTGNKSLSRRAASQAISAGAMSLALKIGRSMPQNSLTTDVRLLLAADELVRGRSERAQAYLSGGGEDGDLSFIAPYVSAWTAVDRRNVAAALTILEQIPPSSLLGSYVNEQRAYILIKAKMTQDAEPFARRALTQGAQRETQMRLALADSFLAAGDKARAHRLEKIVAHRADLRGVGNIAHFLRRASGRNEHTEVIDEPEQWTGVGEACAANTRCWSWTSPWRPPRC